MPKRTQRPAAARTGPTIAVQPGMLCQPLATAASALMGGAYFNAATRASHALHIFSAQTGVQGKVQLSINGSAQTAVRAAAKAAQRIGWAASAHRWEYPARPKTLYGVLAATSTHLSMMWRAKNPADRCAAGRTLDPGKPLFVNGIKRSAGRYRIPPQGGTGNSGHNVAHVVAPALTFDVRVPRAATRKALLRIIGHTESRRASRSQLPCLLVKSHQATALAAGNIFDTVKAEAHHVSLRNHAAMAFAAKKAWAASSHAPGLFHGQSREQRIELPGFYAA